VVVEEGLLDVLGDLPGDVGAALRPRLEPPAPRGHGGVDDVDEGGRAQAAGGEVVDDERPGREQRVRRRAGGGPRVVHRHTVPVSTTANHSVAASRTAASSMRRATPAARRPTFVLRQAVAASGWRASSAR
jgi:hypothetical protein